MVKVIAPKRTKKDISVDEYWSIRQQFTSQAQSKVINYRQEQVQNRHRYVRPTQEAKIFNPLLYFLQKNSQKEIENQSYHVQAYLQTIHFRLPEQIMKVKKMMKFGLKLMILEATKIYDILWSHLGFQDSWLLLQNMLRDTGGENYQYWLQNGFPKLAQNFKTTFDGVQFRNLFNTLCVFMETFFEKITSSIDNLFSFFMSVGRHFYRHENKYIRKFSLQMSSYVLGNVPDPQYYELLQRVKMNEELKNHLNDFFVYKIKYSKGLLTTKSLQQVKDIIEWLNENNQNSNAFGEFIYKVLNNMKTIKQEAETLYDIDNIVSVVVGLCSYNKVPPTSIVTAVVQFIEDQKQKKRNRQKVSLSVGSYEQICNTVLQKLHQIDHRQEVYILLVQLMVNCPGQLMVKVNKVVQYVGRDKEQIHIITLLNKLSHHQVNEQLLKVIIYALKKWFSLFIHVQLNKLQQSKNIIQIAYRIILLIKGMNISTNISVLQIQSKAIISKINQIVNTYNTTPNLSYLYEYCLVYLRFLYILDIQQLQGLSAQLVNLYNATIKKYQTKLNSLLHHEQLTTSDNGLYKWEYFIEEILVYSHHQHPGYILNGINMFQAYIKLKQKIQQQQQGSNEQIEYSLWQKIMINRQELVNELYKVMNSTYQLLKSRHRAIRYSVLQHITHTMQFSQVQSNIMSILVQIDSDMVDLQSERQVKRNMLQLNKIVTQTSLSAQMQNIIMCWILGFAFTGFKLIAQSIQQFTTSFLSTQNNISTVRPIIIKFLQYYNFKNSRLFQTQLHKAFSIIQEPAFIHEHMKTLIDEDFHIQKLQSSQLIGLDRIASAINYNKIKVLLGQPLTNLVSAYFEEQFCRHRKNLQSANNIQQYTQILPPKTVYLNQILKIVPNSYIPPLQCLHFSQNYLQVHSIKQIKKHSWELEWEKKKKTEKMVHIELGNMAIEQQKIYIHYLFAHILKANTIRRRKIVQHIRDRMPNMVQYFIGLVFREWLLMEDGQQTNIINILTLMNSRKLLSFMYVLKSVMLLLKNYMSTHIQTIINVIIAMIRVLFEDTPEKEHQQQPQQQQQQVQQGMQAQQQGQSDKDDDSSHNSNKQQNKEHRKYRNHRKQTYKILTTLVETYHLDIKQQNIDNILQVMEEKGKIHTLAKAAQQSVPGLLIFISKASQYQEYHQYLIKYNVLNILSQMFKTNHKNNNRCIEVCESILQNMLNINTTNTDANQEMVSQQVVSCVPSLLQNIYSWISNRDHHTLSHVLVQRLLTIIHKLMKISPSINEEWSTYLVSQLQRICKRKNITQRQNNKISLYLEISECYMKHISVQQTEAFVYRIISFLPHLHQIHHRQLINNLISTVISHRQTLITNQTANIVKNINSFNDSGLVIEINYTDYFEGIKEYKEKLNSFNEREHQYIIYNILPYLSHQEISIRKSISSTVQRYLQVTTLSQKHIVGKMIRIICEQFRKPSFFIDNIFWSTLLTLSHFIRWIVKNDPVSNQNYQIFSDLVHTSEDKDIFHLLYSLKQSQKMKGLKLLQQKIIKYDKIITSKRQGTAYPHVLNGIIIPILQHILLPITPTNAQYNIEANLASTLTYISLQIYGQALRKAEEGLQKKQLKRVLSKLKFGQNQKKKNIIVIKMIGQIIDSINLPNCIDAIKGKINQQNLKEFYQNINEKKMQLKDDEDDSDQENNMVQKSLQRVNNEIDDEDMVNMNFLSFDKKIIQEQIKQQQPSFVNFLRVHILVPLKAILMYENKSVKDSKEQTQKSRLLVSVILTKLLLKFPPDIFLAQFQKIISKLAKLLKKKQFEIRQNSRKCLSQISKVVGPQLLYIICRQLKFHLKDNFQKHIFNYTIFYVLQKLGIIENGSLDHCLPVILPIIFDEIYGKSSQQKLMVDMHEIPTINAESKKKKGNELLVFICRQLSINKIQFLVKQLFKNIKQFMNSQVNITKYEDMLNNLVGGLGKNEALVKGQQPQMIKIIELMHRSMNQIKGHTKFTDFDEIVKHESMIKEKERKNKTSKKQIFAIQEQAGRNKSIFRKQTKQLMERRNQDIIVNCHIQLYLALLNMLLRKNVITQNNIIRLNNREEYEAKFKQIIQYLIKCLCHRENRIVTKVLKILYNLMRWKDININIKQINSNLQKLILYGTGADQQLQKQALTVFNEVCVSISIKEDHELNIILQIIKLAIVSNEQSLIDQPYKLLQTIMIKIYKTKLIRNEQVVNLYNQVKVTMLNTTHQKIKNICKGICKLFMKTKQFNNNSVVVQEAKGSNNKQKKDKHKQKQHQEKKRKSDIIQKQLLFYLNNLQHKYYQTQVCVLQIIQQYVTQSQQHQIQETGEVIIMSVGLVYANEGNENQTNIRALVVKVANRINKGKVLEILRKCIQLIQVKAEDQVYCVCLYFICECLMSTSLKLQKQIKLNLLILCKDVLYNKCNELEEYRATHVEEMKNRSKVIKNNPQWESMLNEDEQVNLREQGYLKHVMIITKYILKDKQLTQHQQYMNVVESLWNLVEYPRWQIFKYVNGLLAQVSSIGQTIGIDNIMSVQKAQHRSLIHRVITVLNHIADNNYYLQINNAQINSFIQLPNQIFSQISGIVSEQKQTFYSKLIHCLLVKVNKSFINLKKYEKILPFILQLLKSILTFDNYRNNKLIVLEQANQLTQVFKQLLWNLAKVRRNELLSSLIKEKNQQLAGVIEQAIGKDELLRKLAYIESERMQNKKQQKVHMAKLAITDQEAFENAKTKKRRKH